MTNPAPHPVPPYTLRPAAPSPAGGPFGRCTEGVRVGGTLMPSPLVSTAIAVAVRGCLATVTTRRCFRNAEASSIEATLTYPVPVDAVAHGLVVHIGERTLVGRAHAKDEARERYEQAMDEGRTAILHEEPLKGVHILSVGQVPSGAEVIVESTWTKALAARGTDAVLAVPTTVGEVYGRLPLDPGDDLVADGPRATADVTIAVDQGRAILCGEALAAGTSRAVPMDRHIVIAFEGVVPRPVAGRAADGRDVTMTIAPAPAGEAALDLVVLLDRSGSTGDAFTFDRAGTVHAATVQALGETISHTFRGNDRLTLWQFDHRAARLGEACGQRAVRLLRRLGEPDGGTEIGHAVETAMRTERKPRDLLLITDGRSGEIDVHALAGRGWRVSVVLCGAASLDALPGHLAGLTGGQLVAVGGGHDRPEDVTRAMLTLFGQLRTARAPHAATSLPALPERLVERHGGMEIAVAWSGTLREGATADAVGADAVGAYAAALALPLLEREVATRVAIDHGLVTHLTSLLVVDAEGPVQATIPEQRKVPLPAPMEGPVPMPMPMPMACAAPRAAAPECMAAPPRACVEAPPPSMPQSAPAAPRSRVSLRLPRLLDPSRLYLRAPPRPQAQRFLPPLASAAAAIDWRRDGPAIAEGRLDALPDSIRDVIVAAAKRPEIVEAALREGLEPVALVVALMADADTAERTRARIARRIAHLSTKERQALAAAIGL